MKLRLPLYLALALSAPFLALEPASADEAETRYNETLQQAERGDPAAQFALGNMYAQGDGTEQNYVKAHVWFNLAAAADHAEAKSSREIFSQLMTPDQIAEAQTQARVWYAKNKGGEE